MHFGFPLMDGVGWSWVSTQKDIDDNDGGDAERADWAKYDGYDYGVANVSASVFHDNVDEFKLEEACISFNCLHVSPIW